MRHRTTRHLTLGLTTWVVEWDDATVDPAALPLHVEVVKSDDTLVVLRLAGVLDVYSVPFLRNAIAQRPPDAALVIDLRELEFVDTTGIQVLLQTLRASQGPRPWRFALIPGDLTRHSFEVAGLTEVLQWVEDPDEIL